MKKYKIKKTEIHQFLGVCKTLTILIVYGLFIYAVYYFVEKTDFHGVLIGIFLSMLGTFLMASAFGILKIIKKGEEYLESREKPTQEIRDSVEPVNVSEEPKKESKVKKLAKKIIPTKKEPVVVESLQTPKTEVKEYLEVPQEVIGTATIEVQEISQEPLPIEDPLIEDKKLPIEED